MSRPLSERVKDWRWWVDQVLHLILGGSIAYAFSDMGHVGSFVFSSLLGCGRELIQNLRWDGWHGSRADAGVDTIFWALGAIIGSLVA